jgi:hypothetical protein
VGTTSWQSRDRLIGRFSFNGLPGRSLNAFIRIYASEHVALHDARRVLYFAERRPCALDALRSQDADADTRHGHGQRQRGCGLPLWW